MPETRSLICAVVTLLAVCNSTPRELSRHHHGVDRRWPIGARRSDHPRERCRVVLKVHPRDRAHRKNV
jgi:hypothetical protein